MKSAVLLVVALLAGVYLGGWAMQRQIADKFAQGEGRAICESILSEQHGR